ncbi:siroheme synthase [Enterococcus sp. JM4C]|uniref:precorrin-2 dehydrogenase/sirohydrochlorin ferrochelatase family protein n=1 Tax=Candidatus Enterococcus huntleyi TaxID=1857217 RepID=UPI00137AE507|nr:NAD(P)-dependent oxidoreductase [Enterococcus sp. JM4C]KAF1299261.1 siroheme synthase [Enterococcus sp. JM4C]
MYPILVDVSKITIVVVGGGKIATRKIKSLVEAGGRPIVIAPRVSDVIEEFAQKKQVIVKKRAYREGDIQHAQMVFICTDDEVVNQHVLSEVTPEQLVNDTTKQENSNFFNMAFLREDHVGVGITTYGECPTEAKQIKEELKGFVQEKEQALKKGEELRGIRNSENRE